MKAETVLDFAVFQLTPTRTRCDLLISANGVTEKLASGLLKPFTLHLREVEEQIATGGYSIKLEPPSDDGGHKWFTKGTMQKFVRFVNTPEVLERVTAVESELLRLEDELRTIEADDDHPMININPGEKKAGAGNGLVKTSGDDVEPAAAAAAAVEPTETSRSRLLKAMEARQSVLRREQGMAFARAIAAGFGTDYLPDLIAFADHFGAGRLREACLKLTALCKMQEEGGLWLDEIELVAAEVGVDANGVDPFASTKRAVDDDDTSSIKFVDDRKEYHQRRSSSGTIPDHMLPGGPYGPGPWMQQFEHGYDPRYFQPYANGAYPPPPPYWPPPPAGSFGQHPGSVNNDVDEDDEDVASKKPGKKSSLRRRSSSSPLKKLGRGKRGGMVLIRNLNYITQDKKKVGAAQEDDDSEEGSDVESSSEEAAGTEAESKKQSRKKKSKNAASSSEGSHSGTGPVMPDGTMALESSNETFVMPERSRSHYGAGRMDFDTESALEQHKKAPNGSANDTFILGGERSSKRGDFHGQYELDELASGRTRASSDGLLLPERYGGRQGASSNHESELGFRKASGPESLDDAFILPDRGEQAPPQSSNVGYQVYGGRPNENKGAAVDDLFIVPTRSMHDGADVAWRPSLELEEQHMYAADKEKVEEAAPKYEADDMFILPERSAEKESVEKRWTEIDYDMEAMASLQTKQEEKENVVVVESEFLEQYQEQRDAKLSKESAMKKSARDAKMKSLHNTLERRKAELAARSKTTRSSILKSKKEKEEEDRRRIEELAEQRRNRIAARSGGQSGASRGGKSNNGTGARDSVGGLTRSVSALTTKAKPEASPVRKNPAAAGVGKLQTRNSFASMRELKKAEDKPLVKAPAAR